MLGTKHTQICWRNAVFQNRKLQLVIFQFLNTPSSLTGSARPALGSDRVTRYSRYAPAGAKRQSGTDRKICLGNIAQEKAFPPMSHRARRAKARCASRKAFAALDLERFRDRFRIVGSFMARCFQHADERVVNYSLRQGITLHSLAESRYSKV